MAEDSGLSARDTNLIHVLVEKLVLDNPRDANPTSDEEYGELHKETIALPHDAPLSVLWEKLYELGYGSPEFLSHEQKRWYRTSTKHEVQSFEEIEVVQDKPSEAGKCINVDDPLIAFANRQFGKQIELNIAEDSKNDYGMQTESLKDSRGLVIAFHRTVRMPDDDKLHQLPGSLGTFPLYNVSAYAESLPGKIVADGGVFLPMWQREALWMSFAAPYGKNYALRVSVGRVNAVSGLKLDESPEVEEGSEAVQDYVVIPGQEWLDGICVAPGIVRQFVAMPLGSGYTVEGQKTGEEKHGGLQIEIIPSYEENLRRWTNGSNVPTDPDKLLGFFSSSTLTESLTPAELGLSPGAKIRSHSAPATIIVNCQISDLVIGDGNEAHLSATYMRPEFLHAKSRHILGNLSSSIMDMSPAMALPRLNAPLRPMAQPRPMAPPSPMAQPRPMTNGEWFDNSDDEAIDLGVNELMECVSANDPASSSVYAGGVQDGTAVVVENDAASLSVYADVQDGTVAAVENEVNVKIVTKDLKTLGLAAGGKLVQDIYRDRNPAHTWNRAAAKLIHIHILDPVSCETVTHVVPAPPPIDAMGYVEANMPFFVVEEQAENRVDGGDFESVISVSAMDGERGVATEPSLDLSKLAQCKCAVRLCDCVIRPCNHQLCNVCVRELDQSSRKSTEPDRKSWKCPSCQEPVSYVAGFSAPMNLPGEEALKVRVPVNVLEVKDGRIRFKSVQTTRL